MYHQPSSQWFYHWVDTFDGGLLVPVSSVYHQPSSQWFYHWVDTFDGGLLVPECIISLVVSGSITGSIPLMVDY